VGCIGKTDNRYRGGNFMAKSTEAFFDRYCFWRACGYSVQQLEEFGIDCRFFEGYYQKFRMEIQI
jgi:hypothetical protein